MTPARTSAVLSGSPVAPLFAHNARLWLRVWAATQSAALCIALYVLLGEAGGRPRVVLPQLIAWLVVLVAYHVVGVAAYGWILRRTWAVLLFVPLGWVLVFSALQITGVFGLLILGAILQGFIFLPFAWAATVLGLVTTGLATLVALRTSAPTPRVLPIQIGGILATGVMIGTVLLYIHRTNQEAELRARLLRQLDEAQRDLADRARDAGVQEERRRFARDIHDTLAQGFTSVIKHLEAIELSVSAEEKSASMPRVMPHLAHAQAVSRSSLAEIRRLVWALQPAELSEASLAAALGRIVAQWSDANGIPATFTSDQLPALQPDADVIFLRATQESLSNVARHAAATTVAVSLTSVDGLVLLTIEDDGVGFAHTDAQGMEKMGLAGMRERVRRFGGHLLIDSTIGEGTSLTVAMPLSSIAAKA
ncbi:MAG: sensor histidine kinase [Gemmatimonadaceae bacterium]